MTRKEIRQAPTVAVWSCGLAGLEIKGVEYGMEETVLCVWTGDNSAHRCKVRSGRRGPYFFVSGVGFTWTSVGGCKGGRESK